MSIRRRSHPPVYVDDSLPGFLQAPAPRPALSTAVPISQALPPPLAVPPSIQVDRPRRRVEDPPAPSRALTVVPSPRALPDLWFYVRLSAAAIVLNGVLALLLNPQQHLWHSPARLPMEPASTEHIVSSSSPLEARIITYNRHGGWAENTPRP